MCSHSETKKNFGRRFSKQPQLTIKQDSFFVRDSRNKAIFCQKTKSYLFGVKFTKKIKRSIETVKKGKTH